MVGGLGVHQEAQQARAPSCSQHWTHCTYQQFGEEKAFIRFLHLEVAKGEISVEYIESKWECGELARRWSNKMHIHQNFLWSKAINWNKFCCCCSQSLEVIIGMTENKNANQCIKQCWGSASLGMHQQLWKMPD